MNVDLPLAELRGFTYDEPEPPDFDDFWRRTLAEQAAFPLDPVITRVDHEFATVDVFDVEFSGYGGARVKGWLIRPAGVAGPLPAVVEYLGYGGGRGLPIESLAYASAGFAHFVMDTRGQGSTWRTGDTPDPAGTPPANPGHLSRGILDPEGYYYRRLYVDAYRFVDVVRGAEGIDRDRIVATGRSQGGALSVVVGGLRDDLAWIAPQVTFLAAFRRALQVTEQGPLGELKRWLAIHRTRADRAFATLGYFDAVYFARRGRSPASFCVGLGDVVAPPSTVFAVHNAYPGDKRMTVWEFNGHEGGGPEDQMRVIREVRALGTGG
ncbi:acetylxylan esterase [Plantactinospora sp. WMMC1484]|uniref:acetylxylan esterase n=1 Tax=Plantactinospora sp. WMMC1484 TaxID=3404122 RepID=UPI003BF4797B